MFNVQFLRNLYFVAQYLGHQWSRVPFGRFLKYFLSVGRNCISCEEIDSLCKKWTDPGLLGWGITSPPAPDDFGFSVYETFSRFLTRVTEDSIEFFVKVSEKVSHLENAAIRVAIYPAEGDMCLSTGTYRGDGGCFEWQEEDFPIMFRHWDMAREIVEKARHDFGSYTADESMHSIGSLKETIGWEQRVHSTFSMTAEWEPNLPNNGISPAGTAVRKIWRWEFRTPEETRNFQEFCISFEE